jgi:hypothetical protein
MVIRLRIESCDFLLNNTFFAIILLIFLLLALISDIEIHIEAPQSYFCV